MHHAVLMSEVEVHQQAITTKAGVSPIETTGSASVGVAAGQYGDAHKAAAPVNAVKRARDCKMRRRLSKKKSTGVTHMSCATHPAAVGLPLPAPVKSYEKDSVR